MMDRVSGFHVVLVIGIITSLTAGGISDDGCHTLATAPEALCQVTGKFDDPDWVCNATSVVDCEERRYMGLRSTCQNDKNPTGTVYKCITGQWASTVPTTRSAKRRPKRWLFWNGGGDSPPPVNQYPSFTYCPSDITRSASPGYVSTTVGWSTPTATDPDGGTPSVTQVQGSAPYSSFSEGSTPIRYRATDSGGLTVDCFFTVTVTVTRCSTSYIGNFQNGHQTCSANNIYGSQCSHSCNYGYVLSGSSTVSCQSYGTWSPSFPVCNKVSCGSPGSVSSGQWTCLRGYVYLETCALQCNAGFQSSGIASKSCGGSGQWTAGGTCIDVEPPKFTQGCPPNQQLFSGPLESPVTVTWGDPVVTDNSGQRVTLTSEPAKSTSLGPGLQIVRLKAVDSAGNLATCEFRVTIQVRQCQSFTPTANGHVNCTRRFVEGSTCMVACNRGYRLQGQGNVTCLATEQWSGPLPVCNIVVCPRPSNPANGQYICPSGVEFGSVCTLTCDNGYTLQGHAGTECRENSTWTSSGTCSDIDPPQFVNGCPSDTHVYASALGRDTIVRWDTPTIRDTSAKPITLSSNVASGASFPPGVTVVTYTARDVSGNSKSCQFTVNVTVLNCGDPRKELSNPPVTSMNFTCRNGYVFGARCAVSCVQNYRLMGVDAVWCDQNNKTFPPQTFWSWSGSQANKPQCKENRCPQLKAPGNGALSCYHGSLGWDCLMSCDSLWDVPASTDGHFYCTNNDGYWIPSRVPNCVERTGPSHVRLQAEVFYTTDNCNVSLDTLRQRFVTRISQSLFKDACAGVVYCVPDNVQVTCGPAMSRVKRETGGDVLTWTHRQRRANGGNTHTIVLSFHLTLPYYDGGDLSVEETQQAFFTRKEEVFKTIESNVDQLIIDKLPADEFTLSHEPFECPPGTVNIRRSNTTLLFCAGCGAGYYLPVGSSQCQPCPVGSYTDLDNATTCTPCPPTWSTASIGSTDAASCDVTDGTEKNMKKK